MHRPQIHAHSHALTLVYDPRLLLHFPGTKWSWRVALGVSNSFYIDRIDKELVHVLKRACALRSLRDVMKAVRFRVC